MQTSPYFNHIYLFDAIRHENLDEITRLLNDENTNVNALDEKGKTPLMHAVYIDNPEITALILKHPKLKINLQDSNGRTALHHAVVSSAEKSIALLVQENSIDLNMADKKSCTPFHYVKNAKIASLLAEQEALNLNAKDKYGRTLLHAAVCLSTEKESLSAEKNITFIQFLANHKRINVNALDQEENTPLHLAVFKENVVAVKALLPHRDIEIQIENKLGVSPLEASSYRNGPSSKAIEKALLQKKNASTSATRYRPSLWARLTGTTKRDSELKEPLLQKDTKSYGSML